MRVWNQHAAIVIESMEEGMMLRLVWELRVAWEVVWAAAKKIDGARKPNSKEFWARGRDSFDYMYGITGGKGRDRCS